MRNMGAFITRGHLFHLFHLLPGELVDGNLPLSLLSPTSHCEAKLNLIMVLIQQVRQYSHATAVVLERLSLFQAICQVITIE